MNRKWIKAIGSGQGRPAPLASSRVTLACHCLSFSVTPITWCHLERALRREIQPGHLRRNVQAYAHTRGIPGARSHDISTLNSGWRHNRRLVGFLPAGRNDIRVGRRHRGNKDPCHPGPRLAKISWLALDKVLEAIHRFAISTNGCSWIIWPVVVILPISPSNAICFL